MSSTKKGIIGIIWNFGGSVIQIILQLAVLGILARLLSPEEFGIVAILMIVVNFSDLFTHMGIGSALVQLPNISKQHIGIGYSLSLIIGILLGLVFYFSSPLIITYFEVDNVTSAIRFFAIFFPLKSFNSISIAILRRNLRFSIIVKCGIVSYLFGIGLTSIILAYLNFGYWALILGQFASLLITLFLMIYFERPIFYLGFKKKIVRELLFFGSGQTLGTIFNYFAENADNIIIGKSFGSVAMGIYSKAFQLLAVPSKFFGKIFDTVLFPILSRNQHKNEKLKNFYLFSTALCFSLLIPISFIIMVNAKLIVLVLLGNQWNNVVLPLQILILVMAFRFGSKINKSYLKSLGLIYQSAYYQLIFALLMFTCCYIGGYFYELPGVATGVLIASILNYIQMSYRLFKKLKFRYPNFLGILFKSIVFNIPIIFISFLLRYYNITSDWIYMVVTLLIYIPVIAYIFFNKKYIVFNDRNFKIISQISQSFPPKFIKVMNKLTFMRKYYD